MTRRNRPFTRSQPHQAGLSLIELMVALAVSAILLLGVTTVYTGSKRSYIVTNEFAALQENARFALHLLTKNIRMAGFTGCNNLKYMEVSNNANNSFDFTEGNYIVGRAVSDWPADWPAKPANIIGTAVISVKKGSVCSAGLTDVMPNANAAIQTAGSCDFAKGDIVLITDCETADIFKKTNVPQDVQENNGGLSTAYGPDAFVYKFEQTIYFIRNNGEDPPVPGLYQMTVDGAGTSVDELVPNVEDMVFHYGEDTDGDNSIDTIRTSAAAVDKWENVMNVYVRLLFHSEEVGTANKAYTFNDQPVAAADSDKRYRKEFVTAINLRNRTP